MSRTIRRMPFCSHKSLKWYKGVPPDTKPNYSDIRIIHHHPSIWWGGLLETIKRENLDESYYQIITYENGRIQIDLKKSFSSKTTYEEIDKRFEYQIMQYSRKNKTCRRQRKNAVRLTKQLANQEARSRLKMALKDELHSIERDDVFYDEDKKPLSVSERRKNRKMIIRKKREMKKYKKSLEKSNAKTFDDLYVEGQYPWNYISGFFSKY